MRCLQSEEHATARGNWINSAGKHGGPMVSSGACGQVLGVCSPGTAQKTRNSCRLPREHGRTAHLPVSTTAARNNTASDKHGCPTAVIYHYEDPLKDLN